MNHPLIPRSLILPLALLLLLPVLGGCSNAAPPTFSAVGVREVAHDDGRSVIEFSVEARNPNREPIPLRRVSYRVEIGGEVLFEGVRSPETTLHTFSSHVFVLPAVLPESALAGRGEVAYAIRGSAQYIPPGRLSEVLFDAELKVPEALIDLEGTIDTGS